MDSFTESLIEENHKSEGSWGDGVITAGLRNTYINMMAHNLIVSTCMNHCQPMEIKAQF